MIDSITDILDEVAEYYLAKFTTFRVHKKLITPNLTLNWEFFLPFYLPKLLTSNQIII